MDIEQRQFEVFIATYRNGDFQSQRLGQAFWNHFKLDRMADKDKFGDLWELDGAAALSRIRQVFNLN
jgi:hypothetical protein